MRKLLFILALTVLMATSSYADRRKYVWTYQYGTQAPSESELEYYQTGHLDNVDAFEYRLEFEHGLTPNLDFTVYQIFDQVEGDSFGWDATKLRLRYRLAQPGTFAMDPLLYLEYERPIDLKDQNAFEVKLVLSRDFSRTNLSLNPMYEIKWAPGKPTHEFGLDAGLSYDLSYAFSYGIESSTRIERENGVSKSSSYLGPTVSFATGTVFYSFGYAWGVSDISEDGRFRFLMGVGL